MKAGKSLAELATEDFAIYRDATMEASDRAFLMKMEDTVRAAANQTVFDGAVAKMREAQDVESYDRSTDMEATGYSLLTISPALWRQINREAAK